MIFLKINRQLAEGGIQLGFLLETRQDCLFSEEKKKCRWAKKLTKGKVHHTFEGASFH